MDEEQERPRLSELEHAVMQVVWSGSPIAADEVRRRLGPGHELKESTVRTLLCRLEAKGYVSHAVQGRTYLYSPRVQPQSLAAQLVRGIVERLCQGSVERLLVGLVDDRQTSPDELRRLAAQIEATQGEAFHETKSSQTDDAGQTAAPKGKLRRNRPKS